MNRIFKSILLLGLVLFFSQCQMEQNDCEKIFQLTLLEIDKQIKEKGLTTAESELYILNKNEEMKANHPNCFPKEMISEDTLRISGIKLDSKMLTDEKIQNIDKQYQIAEQKCKEELKDTFKDISIADAAKILHECIMEKIVNHN